MKILGVGLSRTGTFSLCMALRILGYNAIHWEAQVGIMNDIVMGYARNPNFRRFDHVEAVVDIPAAYYYKELQKAYPDLLFILTVRDIDSWFQSVKWHYGKRNPRSMKNEPEEFKKAQVLQRLVYGSDKVVEDLYKARYQEHNNNVVKTIPKSKLLIMDITAGDGWEKLCNFLNVPVPSIPFPFENKRFTVPNTILKIKNIFQKKFR